VLAVARQGQRLRQRLGKNRLAPGAILLLPAIARLLFRS